MDTATGERDHEIFFAGGRRQTEIKHLALSSEDEVRGLVTYVVSNPKIYVHVNVAIYRDMSEKNTLQVF